MRYGTNVAVKRGKRLSAYILLNEDKFKRGLVPDKVLPSGLKVKPDRIAIDLEHVKGLAAIGCTYSEMAMVLGCSEKFICEEKDANPAFAIALEQGEGEIKSSLRRAQLDEAINGRNASLLIWLGKQYLGQVDKQEVKNKTEINITVQRAMDELRNIPREQLLAAQELLSAPVIENEIEKTPADAGEG